MENYLLDLIKNNNRIIIPNFGAFIVSRDNGENILFNNFLSFNDGLLISHICSVDGINSAEATQIVDDYIVKVKASLDSEGKFTVQGIGTFVSDESKIIRFEPEASIIANIVTPLDADNKENDKVTEDDLLDLDMGAEPEIKSKAKPEVIAAVSAPAASPKTVEKSKTIVPPKSAPVANNETPKIEEKPKTVVSPKPLAVKETTKTEMKPPVSNNIYINEERSNKGWLIPVIAFVILLVAAIVLWFFTDVLDKYKSKPAPAPPPPIEQIVEEEEVEIVEEPEIVETPIIATRQHHIIVGSFKEEANARELKNKIAEQGFSSSSVFEHKGMFLVSAEWHQAVSVALQRQEEMLNTNKLENWVLSISVK